MKKILLMLVLIVFVFGCTSNTNTIKVGLVAPMTGDAAYYGYDIAQGIELAKLELEKDLDVNIKLYVEDACLANDALKSIQKLVNGNNIDLVTGVFCIPAVHPIASQTKDSKISVMMTATVPGTFTEGYIFSPNSAIKDEAKAQAEYAYNKLNAKTASILWMNSDFGKSYSERFSKRFLELGGTILSNEPLEFFGKDYRTELAKVKAKNPDLLLAVHFGNQMSLILKQSKELDLNSQIMGTYESEDENILNVAGAGAEGLIFSSPISSYSEGEALEFRNKYVETYNEEPTVVAAMAYDGLKLQVKAFSLCKGNKDCIINELSNTKDYDGASGIFSIGKEGTAKREFAFKEVKNGKFTLR